MIPVVLYEHGAEVLTVLCEGFEVALDLSDILLEGSTDENAYVVLG